ncbi:MAG: penicillin-binding protein [Desulforhabdus sp.]|jgi:cell division protein FtsI (penicillin-binding protein 3)|nr:penicillin-binding protein [Desulforhabdus sp.]
MDMPKAGNFQDTRYRICCAFLRIIFVASFLLIIGKAFHLQVIEHPVWLERSRAQAEAKLNVSSYRGSIYDNRGRLMAFSVPQASLFADGKYMKDPKRVATRLAPIIGEQAGGLQEKLASGRRFIWIKRQLTDQQAIAVENLKESGLYTINEYRRFYPFRQVAGQVLGFVGVDGKGLEGVERAYDALLAGKDVVKDCLRDGLRRGLWLRSSPPPEPGEDSGLRLTLDAYLQYVSEVELKKGAAKYNAKAGEVVIVDPRTFEVLAMANWPFFDPNHSGKKNADSWRNRAITDSFEPGSTFKVFLVTAALEEGAIKTGQKIFCENGKYRVARHTINDVHPYGWLTIPEVIKYSSNIAASKIALELGSERYSKYISDFGFGVASGISLPGEAKGLVRPWEKWRPMDLAATGFGQAIGVTALQLTMAIAAIANGGVYGQPVIAKEVVDSEGEPVRQFTGTAKRRIIQKRTAEKIRAMMQSVTEEGGTGIQAAPAGYSAAGKTGTAQMLDTETGRYASNKFTSIFTGYIPADDPRLVMTVVIHEPRGAIYGGVVAGPIFRGIAAKALPYLGVFPSSEHPESSPGLRLVSGKNDGEAGASMIPHSVDCNEGSTEVPDVIGLSLKLALQKLAPFGVQTEISGSGKVIFQQPPGGTPIKSGTVVELVLNESH